MFDTDDLDAVAFHGQGLLVTLMEGRIDSRARLPHPPKTHTPLPTHPQTNAHTHARAHHQPTPLSKWLVTLMEGRIDSGDGPAGALRTLRKTVGYMGDDVG